MRYFVLILLLIIFVPIISAVCEDNQIDINSASLEELDELTGIGPVYAGRIVESRPFESLEDLIEVNGIGEITLQKIKDQGLACVVGDDEEIKEEVIEEDREEVIEEDREKEVAEENILSLNDSEKKVETISLNSKVANEKDDLVYSSKNAQVVDYLPYGFALFLIFIIGFLIWERF